VVKIECLSTKISNKIKMPASFCLQQAVLTNAIKQEKGIINRFERGGKTVFIPQEGLCRNSKESKKTLLDIKSGEISHAHGLVEST
jgi:hypothetical protein